MTYNAGRRKDVRENEKVDKTATIQRHEIMSGIMSLPSGRAWICDLLEFCHIFSTSYSPNPQQMAFAEGKRNVGLRLLEDIMSSVPKQYVTMMEERNYRDASRDTRTDARDDRDAANFFGPAAERTGGEAPDGGTEVRPVNQPADDGWTDTVYGPFEADQRKAKSA